MGSAGGFKVTVFSFEPYDAKHLSGALKESLGETNVKLVPAQLGSETISLAAGSDAVCLFVNDKADAPIIEKLASLGIKLILLRNAGFNNVDLESAQKAGISVRRVPVYSPYAVAEFAVALLLAAVRKIHKAYNRVREHNFSISGLEGFDIRGKVIGVIGTGAIGAITAKLLNAFGPSKLLGYDVYQNEELKTIGMEYVTLEELVKNSDIITLHCPLLPSTYHIFGKEQVAICKEGLVLINTSRGGLVDAAAVEEGIKGGKIGAVALDVYENESSYFFSDCSDQIITDDVLSRLLTYPNVIITAHQAFLTHEALQTIADVTVQNIKDFKEGKETKNECKPAPPK